MRALCASLAASEISLPRFTPVAVGKVMTLLCDRQCNIALFRDIYTNIHSLLLMLSQASVDITYPANQNTIPTTLNTAKKIKSKQYDELIINLIPLTQFVSGLSVAPHQLIDESQQILANIRSTLAVDGDFDDIPNVDANGLIPSEFFRRNEGDLRGKLNRNHPAVAKMYKGIDYAARVLCETVKESYSPDLLDVSLDLLDNAIFYTMKKSGKINSGAELGQGYIQYVDRKGKESKKRVTTTKLREALNRYLLLVSQTVLQVTHMLQNLSEEVGKYKFSIIQVRLSEPAYVSSTDLLAVHVLKAQFILIYLFAFLFNFLI